MSNDQKPDNIRDALHPAPEIAEAPRLPRPLDEDGTLSHAAAHQFADHHDAFASFHEEYTRSYVQLADTKATWIFAAASAMLVFLWVSEGAETPGTPPGWNLEWCLLISGSLALLASATFAFLVILPRLKSSGEGLINFVSVSERPESDSFLRELARSSKNDIVEARLRHTYDVARVCRRKYSHLLWAMWLGFFGLAVSILHIIVR